LNSPDRDGCGGRKDNGLITKQETIDEITRRLVEACQPVRVYLFGSEARGDAGPDSDLDFLVVVPDDAGEDVFRSGRLRQAIGGVGHAVDVIPWRRTDFEGRAAYVVASLPATVVREGRLLYDAERVAA
jgi:predicted nucleotidyltransferase